MMSKRRITAPRRVALIFLATLLLLLHSNPLAFAQPATPFPGQDIGAGCVDVLEPNDQPAQAIDLGSGAVCANATQPAQGQDVYRWTVEQEHAGSLWTFTIPAIPANSSLLEIYEVELDAAGTVTAARNLISTSGEPDQPTVISNLILVPGTYYLGVATSAPEPYQLSIAPGDPLPDEVAASETPIPVSDAFATSGVLESNTGVTLTWTVTEEAATDHLDLAVQAALGTSVSWVLANASGSRLYSSGVDTNGTSHLPDVGLAPGVYSLTIQSSSDVAVRWIASASATTPRDPSLEDEPNEGLENLATLTFDGDGAAISGRLAARPSPGDTDHYALVIDDRLANRLIDLRLLWQGPIARRLCLIGAAGEQLRCADGETGLAINDLVLTAGTYFLRVTGQPDPTIPYVLKVDVTGEAIASFEAEPNDVLARATTMVPEGDGFVSAGRLAVADYDYFRISVTGEPQLWLIEITGPTASIELVDITDAALLSAGTSNGSARIYDAFLVPGDHHIRVRGEPGDYAITATPLGPPDPRYEHEPNNAVDRSQPSMLLEERTGRIASIEDADLYRFSLRNPAFAKLDLAVPADAAFTLYLMRAGTTVVQLNAGTPGEPLSWQGHLDPGDYIIDLRATTPSLDPYRLTVTPLDPFAVPDDLEPNNEPHQAAPFPSTLRVSGMLNPQISRGDVDWYRLPAGDATQVAIEYSPQVEVRAWTMGEDVVPTQLVPREDDTGDGATLVDVPPGQPLLLEVAGTGSYDIALGPADAPSRIAATPVGGVASALAATLDLGQQSPAAYWPEAQVVKGTLELSNNSRADAALALDAATGHYLWEVEFAQETVSVGAGETVEVPVTVRIAPDAWADHPIYVAIRAADGGVAASAMALVVPDRTVPPLSPERWEPLPPTMLGGVDIAWSGLGATPVAVDEAAAVAQMPLHDQLHYTGNGWSANATDLPIELTVDLAGDTPVPVAGVILFPPGTETHPDTYVRSFELDLSQDGSTWETVVTGELTAIPAEQAFALASPVEAAFARLRILSVHGPTPGAVTLGEWKVVASPAWEPGPLDIGAWSVGGHVVLQEPPGNLQEMQLAVSPDQGRVTVAVPRGSPVSLTIGFHHNRAAQVTAITWRDPPDSDPAGRFDTVTVEVSTESPIGPWTPLGEFRIDRDASGAATLQLESPTWARFVRIGGVVPESGDDVSSVNWELPDVVGVIEAPVAEDYRSILGEWGTYSAEATYERQVAPEPIELDGDAGNDAGSATLLQPGSGITNSAAFEVDEDWYRIEIPPGDGVLALTLTGIPALGVSATLFDDAGNEVPLSSAQISSDSLELEAAVEPGATYLLHLIQPPTSVVFAFDTSASIGSLINSVYQGLNGFASDVLPGREYVNVLPFGEELLLEEWSDQPYQLQSAIAAYPRTSSSSEAEQAIIIANKGLAPRAGNRAIILITDAEGGQYEELWPSLASVAPRIFSVHIAGTINDPHGQDLLQDWALVNSGSYVYARDQGELDIAFDRAATELRRPAMYSVQATTRPATPTPTPEPTPTLTATPGSAAASAATPAAAGSLEVLAPSPGERESGSVPASREGQVAIILDTSGSMLQDLNGQTRADVAKTALIDLVTTAIPAGTSVSLRTFGNTPDSCETILVVPASPLEPDVMASTIANLPIVNLVRTPIGASLEAVADDLAGTAGPKIVVLVTDGEETCAGDPAAAIEALVASGIDVRVNIVGFAIDDPALEATFAQWAELGNGQYIDAGNAAELGQAVAQAALPIYEVRDASGAVVGTGQVGADPVVVQAGIYTVVIRSDPEIVIEDVVVEPQANTEVAMPPP